MKVCLSLFPGLIFLSTSFAATALHEDFESHSPDTPAAQAGWQYFAGNGSLDQIKIVSPVAPENTSSLCLSGSPDGPDIQIFKPFATTFDVPDSTTDIDYSVRIAPRPTGQKVPRILFGVRTAEEKMLYLFGTEANDYSTSKFAFRVGSTVSQQFYPAGHLYEVRLTLELKSGLSQATGSLAIKDLTAGNPTWQPIEDLQHVPLPLTDALSPMKWTAWLIRSEYRREVDDLSLSLQREQP